MSAAEAPESGLVWSTQLVGKTIAAVTTRGMAAKDAYKDWVSWTETRIEFTDGTWTAFAEESTETYEPAREVADWNDFGDPVFVDEVDAEQAPHVGSEGDTDEPRT